MTILFYVYAVKISEHRKLIVVVYNSSKMNQVYGVMMIYNNDFLIQYLIKSKKFSCQRVSNEF